MKKIIRVILVAAFLSCGASELHAQCTCSNGYESAHDELKRAQAVFVGEVVEVKKVGFFEDTEYVEFDVTFRVMAAWKNDLPETLTVRNTSEKKISSDFKEKERYLIYAYLYHDTLSTGTGCCTRTSLLSSATEDIKEFRLKGEKPTRIIKAPASKAKLQD